MAKTRSAAKQARASLRRRAHNKSILSRLHTLESKFLTLVSAKSATEAAAAFRLMTSALDKAAKTQVIHRNNAARKKSRLSARLKAVATGKPSATPASSPTNFPRAS
jgi:small subunit ribosomal protein S20